MTDTLKKKIDRSLKDSVHRTVLRYELDKTSPLLMAGLEDFVIRPGKRVRPMLFLISYAGYSSRKSPFREKTLRCAASMELLHDFLLVHDDVIDNSPLRRGKPTLHRVFNKNLGLSTSDKTGSDLSIVAGDILFAMAMDAFWSIDELPARKEKAFKIFNDTAALTGTGEFIDVVGGMEHIRDVSKKEVFLIYTLKTAKYTFECPLITGAILGGAPEKDIRALSRIGISLGQAFQIQDDLLDIFSSSRALGKPVLSDLDESKKTLAAVYTYGHLSGKQRNALERIFRKKKKTSKDLDEYRRMVTVSGAREYCESTISNLLESALSLLDGLSAKKKYVRTLKNIFKAILSAP